MAIAFDKPLLDSISDPVTIIDHEYRLIYANSVKIGLLKSDLQHSKGKHCYTLTFGRKEPCYKCPVKAVLITGRSCVIERRFECADGTKVWSEMRAYPILSEGEKIAGVIVIGHDITHKKREVENRLHYIEELERSIAQNSRIKAKGLSVRQSALPVNLSLREIEVLQLLAEGFTNPEIGSILALSVHTIKTHVISIFNKLGVNDRTQAAVWAVRQKLI